MTGENIVKPAYRFTKDMYENLIKEGFIKEDRINDLNKRLEEIKETSNKILEEAGLPLINENTKY